MRHQIVAAFAIMCCAISAHAKDIRIGHVYDKTGPYEVYAKQTQTGLMMGLEYATKGTMAVNGNKLVVIERDNHGKPDVGRAQLSASYQDDKVDLAVGPTSSGVALAMLPIAAEYKKILIVDPAVSDAITGSNWNRYIFHTARNSSMDAIASAVVMDKPGVSVVTLAQDYAFGRSGISAFKDALKHAKVLHEEYVPPATTDFTAATQRLADAIKDKPGRKIIWILWAGANTSGALKVAEDLKRHGVEIITGANILPAMSTPSAKQFVGAEGFAYYYFGLPKNPINDWLVKEHYKRFKTPPDLFTMGGMVTGIAVVEALKKTQGDTDTEKLIATMEGMNFDTPKGKMTFRKEDHQALQTMYHVKFVSDPAFAWIVPTLVREIGINDMHVPIRNKQ